MDFSHIDVSVTAHELVELTLTRLDFINFRKIKAMFRNTDATQSRENQLNKVLIENYSFCKIYLNLINNCLTVCLIMEARINSYPFAVQL